jgi:uncharacterized membrane protein YozB (DUF420 family)
MNEQDWEAFRRRARRRSGAMMVLIVGPVILFVVAVTVFRPHHFPAGDIRNEPLFWIVAAIIAVAFIGTLIAGSVRELRRPDDPD